METLHARTSRICDAKLMSSDSGKQWIMSMAARTSESIKAQMEMARPGSKESPECQPQNSRARVLGQLSVSADNSG